MTYLFPLSRGSSREQIVRFVGYFSPGENSNCCTSVVLLSHPFPCFGGKWTTLTLASDLSLPWAQFALYRRAQYHFLMIGRWNSFILISIVPPQSQKSLKTRDKNSFWCFCSPKAIPLVVRGCSTSAELFSSNLYLWILSKIPEILTTTSLVYSPTRQQRCDLSSLKFFEYQWKIQFNNLSEYMRGVETSLFNVLLISNTV